MRRRLLWIDGLAGAAAGIAVLLLLDWLTAWYGLPRDFLRTIGVVNLVYGSYSLSLASRPVRPMALIVLLVFANSAWALLCFRWAFLYSDRASVFGMAHLIGEGIFVAILASLEWRWRELLRRA